MCGSQISFNDFGILHGLARGTDSQQRALVEDGNSIGKCNYRTHEVLDEYDRGSTRSNLLDHNHCLIDLGRSEATEHLVEKQQARMGSEGTRQLHKFAFMEVER